MANETVFSNEQGAKKFDRLRKGREYFCGDGLAQPPAAKARLTGAVRFRGYTMPTRLASENALTVSFLFKQRTAL
jgi:hypothetical protein